MLYHTLALNEGINKTGSRVIIIFLLRVKTAIGRATAVITQLNAAQDGGNHLLAHLVKRSHWFKSVTASWVSPCSSVTACSGVGISYILPQSCWQASAAVCHENMLTETLDAQYLSILETFFLYMDLTSEAFYLRLLLSSPLALCFSMLKLQLTLDISVI